MTTAAAPDTSPVQQSAPGAIAGRVFVVGCARSGTTLVQSFLAAHPWVLSFPETAVFGRLFHDEPPQPVRDESGRVIAPGDPGRTQTMHRRTQLAYRMASELLRLVGRRDLERLLPMRSRSLEEFARGFVAVLDRLSLDAARCFWVEKTPENIRYVPQILGAVAGAKVVNILRDGRENVAAMYDMSRKYPDRWWIRYRDLDASIEHWNQCARATRLLLGHPDVLVIRHEALRANPEAVMREVCRFAGLPFTREMIRRRAENARSIVTAREPWKADVLADVRSAVEDRFERVLDPEQRAYVEARLERVEF
jgi:hypothetical protein